MRNDLPETCLSTLPGDGKLIILKRGETGYYPSDWDTGDKAKNQEIADYHNGKRGINPAQVEAMRTGSMFGFHVPGADPQIYFDQAKLIQTYQMDLSSTIKHPIMAVFCNVAGKLHQYQVAGKDAFYLEPANIPDGMMGIKSDFIVLMDMVQGKPLIPVTTESSPYRKWSLIVEPGAAAFRKEINEDYQVIAKVQVGSVEYALGEMDGKIPFFVTWERTPSNDGGGLPNYYWGHYFDSREKVIQDFCTHASEKHKVLAEYRKPSIRNRLAAAKAAQAEKPTVQQHQQDKEAR